MNFLFLESGFNPNLSEILEEFNGFQIKVRERWVSRAGCE
jgi:hypothetical protein